MRATGLPTSRAVLRRVGQRTRLQTGQAKSMR